MKVYQVYTTNMWQNSDSRENISIASDIETARVFVRSALRPCFISCRDDKQ